MLERYRGKPTTVPDGGRLPYALVACLAGDAGFGRTAPIAVPTDQGVLVSRRGCVSLHSADLSEEKWRYCEEGWVGVNVVRGGQVVCGPIGGQIVSLDLRHGKPLTVFSADEVIAVVAASDDTVLAQRSKGGVRAYTWDGQMQWESEEKGQVRAVIDGKRIAIADTRRTGLKCRDLASGEPIWSFVVPTLRDGAEGILGATFGSDAAVTVQSGVLTIRCADGRLYSLDGTSGSIVLEGRDSLGGAFVSTASALYSKRPFGLHGLCRDTFEPADECLYEEAVVPLYGMNRPTVNAFCLTEESVIWTTMHGVLMGVSRRPGPDGKRVTWSYEVPGAIMPIGEPPVAWGDYLYFTKKGENPELLCFKSAAAAD